MNTDPINRPWLVARLIALLALSVAGLVLFSSWVVATVIGGLTILGVALDGLILMRAREADAATSPPSTEHVRIDVSRRR